jgi:hypothetical protein
VCMCGGVDAPVHPTVCSEIILGASSIWGLATLDKDNFSEAISGTIS